MFRLQLRLQDKILAILLSVIVPFATLTFLAVERKISRESAQKLSAELEAARGAFDEIRKVGLDDLDRSARLVSDLPYLKAAVAVYDPAAPADLRADQINTILPIAGDIVKGVGLDFLALTDLNGRIITVVCEDDTLPAAGLGPAFQVLRERADREGNASGCIPVKNQIYEVVLCPITAAGTRLGSLALGRRFDDELATQIRKMTDSEMFILAGTTPIARCCGREDRARETAIARYLEQPGHRLPDPTAPLVLDLAGENFLTLWTPITDPDGRTIGSYVMQRSLDEAMAYVHAIRSLMIVIWTAALVAGILLSWILARQISRPIHSLVRASQRIAAGDFSTTVPVTGEDEVAVLASSFNQMSRELRETQAQLIQAGKMAAFGELGAGIAHDLNQPLAAAKGFAQLTLNRLEPGSPHRRPLELIVASVDHMTRIVSGLKKFARQSNFESAPVDLNGVIHQTEVFLAHSIKRQGIRLELDLDADLPLVSGDATQLQQVLTNLITNARDALAETNDPVIQIRTGSVGKRRMVVCQVSDNGPGIPPEVRRNIFRSFFTTKGAGEGTGLGLSISRGIVQNHGGRLGVHCPARGGTTFTLVLPVGGARQRDLPEESGRKAA